MLSSAVTFQRMVLRGGWISLVWGLVLSTGSGYAADEKPLDSEQTARLIQELDHESYAIRKAATEELSKAGPQVLPPLVEAMKTGSLERKLRLVDLIGLIYNTGDEASFDQAELALEAAAKEKSSSLRSQASSILRGNSELRERMAVAAIRRLGGSVNYQSPNRIQGIVDPEQEPGKAQVIGFVVLTKDWKGGDEGLWHLRRLPQLRLLYRVKTAKVSDEAIDKLRDELGVQVQTRGAAKLGIANGGGIGDLEGCVVGDVTPDGAADKAGIKQNDIIIRFDNQPVKDFEALITQIGEKQPGDIVPITVERNGENVELKAELSGW